ncbi:MAG: P-loop NTPase [Melioribacteraceae bacterium]|nr:P-loop NTPase [Melioribacteraceae bacterium]
MIGQAERVYQLNRGYGLSISSSKSCPYIAFTSGKGGTGKSFCALNIAYNLADLGKKVLLIDLDFNLSNIHLMMDVLPSATLANVLNQNRTIEETVHHIESNLDLIFGDSGNLDLSISLDDIKSFFNKLNGISKQYDVVLFDAGSGAGDEILEVLSIMDEIIIVTTPEPTSVMDAYVVAKLLKQKKIKISMSVIVNKCPNLADGETAFQNLKNAVTHFLKEEIDHLGSLQFSSDALKSIMDQRPLFSFQKDSELIDQLGKLSAKIAKNKQMVNNNH